MKRLSRKNHHSRVRSGRVSSVHSPRLSFLIWSALGLLSVWIGPFVPKAVQAQTTAVRLQQADKVRMVQSKDASNKPFFRMRLTIPEGVPKLKDPKGSFEILEGDHKYAPFYVQLGQETVARGGAAAGNSRFALLVIDVSGSMLERLATGQTKFEAAKAAARQFLSGFQPGTDNIAVVSFESRRVASTVRRASFAGDSASVQAQIDDLPMPDRKGNTGLYTAVMTGLEVLNQKKTENSSRSAMLLVLTDGKNDVHPDKGDDAGLLQGEKDLSDVVRASRSSGFTVVTIGFGDKPGSIDTDSLKQIASPDHFWSASNLQSLQQIFAQEKQALINEFGLTFATDWQDARSLTGRDIRFRVRLKGDDGRLIESEPISFATPQSAPPTFEGLLTVDEETNWMDRPRTAGSATEPQTGAFENVIISRLVIMAALAIALAIFWFGLPRAFWPESYLRSVASSMGLMPEYAAAALNSGRNTWRNT